ncbi:2,3-bisphosphoglycerate-independent phosphoglycerate mutase [Acidithiobacillus sp. CV18-2]|uniref:2,3-bisphosphoglycerate-independent phosphoglycerate mutase n=1 Tax=Igneacidithiobacillus copahuensis TaxID=2724909 RepID=A0AAE2YS75_9PROT|nr:2,3-bisphosphoglycerate-independent phosphoglycerate mutase [Igneacidithiobacillus copahuensis]MBU2753584.1 2,3-bisphosphoglycerate-independent phosphoglycerate mutase [Acidithiobacillus sp. CV18-3]MBU2757343.1 2,3-bisphosphoglycerate-independent phosphoglycerate mutase [Acidithiobacillus sp. BN09-2]MBU2776078.1 2,3-bisphosphoglycerate-independent phosphoglycerate mutase [Acidithiobacillus sp. CV18-2]MBU2795425.1 2,3-bisphosphoglycerate-independent phosphoglycerate mutase [Acidithiobacillus 
MPDKKVLLVIFDGFGLNPSRAFNGWAQARTPHLDHYFASNPHSALQASGRAVGLPDGQFGNSEVGHLTLGSGRILKQDLLRIADAIADGSLERLPNWQKMLQKDKRIHLIGMVSDGGVHSHIEHLLGLLPLLVQAGMEPVVHFISDGRDTPPRSADRYVQRLQEALQQLGTGHIATLSGRYYAMDRAQHWKRTEKAWRAMLLGEGQSTEDALSAVQAGWQRDDGDEFIQPTVIGDPRRARIAADEPVLFFNFRSDRMRQLCAAIALPNFAEFDRGSESARVSTCMTAYDENFALPVLFPTEIPAQVLAEVLANAGLAQFHCAETEKYAHVTYFFNGGREQAFAGEERTIIPSPAVATYDLQPEMSAPAVADRVIGALRADKYAFVLVNFANGDMVGHTAKIPAILRAVETLDLQFHRIVQVALAHGYRVILSADHGNCDEMVDPVSGEPHTQHTVYPVPFLLLGEPGARLGIGAGLADVAPTVLDLLGVEKPQEMTGRSLLLHSEL